MDLSPGQKKAVFAVVVVVLAALGYWLLLPKLSNSHGQARPAASPAPAVSTPGAQPSQPGAAPAGTATPAAAGGVDIYSWLPFTQQGLAAAAAVTEKFVVDYNTYSYTEGADAYVGRMNGLITTQLADTLRGLYSTPGVVKVRTDQKQVSTGTVVIDSLRAFGPSSLTFIVTGTQHLTTTKGTSSGSSQYAVTLTGSGTSWQVNDIELSSVGQS
ncbi:MAG TPA: hypothetical protein VMK84_27520 [Streptosporangiaceae bacterium]|nr:hypothetical protein [Streptosporangiaceae bacterium]